MRNKTVIAFDGEAYVFPRLASSAAIARSYMRDHDAGDTDGRRLGRSAGATDNRGGLDPYYRDEPIPTRPRNRMRRLVRLYGEK